MKEMSDLICGKAAVGGNYNSTRDIQTVSHNMRVQDTVIMMKHMITAIWMCIAGCIRHFPRFRNIWTRTEANHFFW